MSADQIIYMPNYVDDPYQLLIWELDEGLPVGIAAVVGVLTNQMMWCLLAGFALVYAYRRVKDGNPDGAAFHVLYWFGLYPTTTRTMPNPFARKHTP